MTVEDCASRFLSNTFFYSYNNDDITNGPKMHINKI